MKRRSLFPNLLAALVGLGLLGALEGILHLVGAGPSSRLFIDSERDGRPAYTINRDVAHRFFQRQYLRHVPFGAHFARHKPAGTVRIFVLGASTLIGFPNPPYTSFPQFLTRMLSDAYPGQQFELLNCGITAINTFCILDFVEEIVDYEPDLIVFYAGHNEVIGPYGVTTPFLRIGNDRALIRLYMQLQRSRLYYWLKELIYGAQRWWEPDSTEKGFGLHLASKEIGLLDEGYLVTCESYEKNLEEILLTANERGIPVLLSTLVSNLKDFYPLRSDCDGPEITQRLADLVHEGQTQQAIQTCREGLQASPYCANLYFELGRIYYDQGEYGKARQAFGRARDMDRLPFRAPTVFNQTIRRLATRTEGENLLGDTEAAFVAASPHGIIGGELIVEYLHPTVYGHYLIALNMARTLVKSSLGESWGPGDARGLKEYSAYADQLGYALLDQISTRNDLMIFLRQMPYRHPPPILRRQVADLMRQQMRDIPRLEAEERRDLVRRGGLVFLSRMLDFALPDDRRLLAPRLKSLEEEL